jgi:hypothetical protein
LEQNDKYEQTCKQYLLGELTETEQAQFEEAYFVDDQLFERFLAVKDDLVDAYARKELGGSERERFEQHFLATQSRRERVNQTREFIQSVSLLSTQASERTATHVLEDKRQSTTVWQSFLRLLVPGRPVTQGAFAVLLLLAVVGSVMVVRRVQRDRAERLQAEALARKQQQDENARPVGPGPTSGSNIGGLRDPVAAAQPSPALSPAPKPANTNRPAPPLPAQVASISLMPFSSRSGDSAPNSLKLGPETGRVHLRLIFKDDDSRSFEVNVRTVGGEQIAHQRGLKAQSVAAGKRVTLTVTSTKFQGQDYIITLSGLSRSGKLEPLNDYYLRVDRTPR